jgi:hypothetical protein
MVADNAEAEDEIAPGLSLFGGWGREKGKKGKRKSPFDCI